MAITLPVLWALYHVGKGGLGGLKEHWTRLLALAGLSLVYVGILWTNGFLPGSLEQSPRPVGEQIWTQIKGLFFYLKLVLMPVSINENTSSKQGQIRVMLLF